ncbi:hypothetical protein ABIF81_003589 [Bradyrhizobium daqingense]
MAAHLDKQVGSQSVTPTFEPCALAMTKASYFNRREYS